MTNIHELLVFINTQLQRNDHGATIEYKTGLCNTIEWVLHEHGLYQGFMFIDNNDRELNSLGYFSRQYYSQNHI